MENEKIIAAAVAENASDGLVNVVIQKAYDICDPVITPDFTGALSLPRAWAQAQTLDSKEAIIRVNRSQGIITLLQNQWSSKAALLSGVLHESQVLKDFDLTSGRTCTPIEMAKRLRMKSVWFTDKAKFTELIMSLMQFTAKQEVTHEANNDLRGNTKALKQRKITDFGVPETFSLTVPLFTGDTVLASIRVEIQADFSTSECYLYLESSELAELLETEKSERIDEELAYFSALSIPILEN